MCPSELLISASEPKAANRRIKGMCRLLKGGIRGVKRAVVIGNGVAGAENQCIGLVRALGLSDRYTLYRARRPTGGINKYLRWLPLSIHRKVNEFSRGIYPVGWSHMAAMSKQLVPDSAQEIGAGVSDITLEADAKRIGYMAREAFLKNGPLLVVASGRDTAPVASSIKKLAPDNVFVVQIQHPRMKLDRFDLIITPRHDYFPLTPQGRKQVPWFLQRWMTPSKPPEKHVVLTIGALHHADLAALQIAAAQWHAELAYLTKPLLVVNIGGPSCHCKYGENLAKQIAAYLQNVLWSCGSVRISFSRRTPQNISKTIERELNYPKVYIWDGVGQNPHLANLAWADAFVITADSVSMLSEACSTGKPVYVVGAELCTWKIADFHKSLLERGATRPFTGREDISKTWSYPPLNDTIEAANHVQEALAEKGWIVRTQVHE